MENRLVAQSTEPKRKFSDKLENVEDLSALDEKYFFWGLYLGTL